MFGDLTVLNFDSLWNEMVAEFRVEAGSCTIVGCNATPSLYIYVVNKFGHRHKQWHVSVNAETLEIKCSCLKMESVGIPCGHIIAVLVFLDIEDLPDNLILLRWRMSVKETVVRNNEATPMCLRSQTISRNTALAYWSRQVCNLACKTEEDFNEYLDKFMLEFRHLESKHIEGPGEVEAGNVDVHQNIGDPVEVRFKGCGPRLRAKRST
ncbi:hypothetical protein RJT34_23748 [Clitoria ternatea]|uniref:Protein FAR1-RELATED SEQUENCE n=1 Tax=Clitoria ternatea TaxID=43366 RepID=A0AAN9FLP1_CLITE